MTAHIPLRPSPRRAARRYAATARRFFRIPTKRAVCPIRPHLTKAVQIAAAALSNQHRTSPLVEQRYLCAAQTVEFSIAPATRMGGAGRFLRRKIPRKGPYVRFAPISRKPSRSPPLPARTSAAHLLSLNGGFSPALRTLSLQVVAARRLHNGCRSVFPAKLSTALNAGSHASAQNPSIYDTPEPCALSRLFSAQKRSSQKTVKASP